MKILLANSEPSTHGTSQPWQLPRRTAGHGSKADAGAQPLADSQSASKRIAELEQEIERLQRTEECRCHRHRRATRARMSGMGVRRHKAALSSGCKSHPATAPAGSNRSSYGGNEVAEAFGVRVTNW